MSRSITLSISAALLLAACGGDSKAGEAIAAPTVIRVSAIPDFNKGKLDETAKALCAWLQQEVGVEVRYEASSDYTATVNGLVANKLDLVWYGGLTAVEAQDEAKSDAVFLACRDIDLKFRSYFIGNRQAIADGKLAPVGKLADLAPMLKNATFTFGDKKSTSGHLMPRHFLVAAGLAPETAFKSPAAYRTSGGHAATLQAVISGEVDCGALNFSYYDKAKPEERAAAPILFTTPDYVDYCWVGHRRLGEATLAKIKAALLKLDPQRAADKAVLDAWGAGRFVAANAADWDSIRQVKQALPKDFLR